MKATLRTLLSGILDYAGLFPPASLDMAGAVESWARYREGRYAWMLSHFICPASGLDAFEAAAAPALAGAAAPWTVSLIGRGGDDLAGLVAALHEDAGRASALEERYRGAIEVRALELRAPDTLGGSGGASAAAIELLSGVRSALDGRLPGVEQVFIEVGFGAGWEARLPRVFSALTAARAHLAPRTVGVKLRTGGIEASAVPGAAETAEFLALARDVGVPFKATAGLHHPLRHHAAAIDAPMHGFLNVFAGAALLFAGQVNREELTWLLEDEDASAFHWTDDSLTWRGHACSREETASARRNFALAFGSCSFTEPLEDLDALGLL